VGQIPKIILDTNLLISGFGWDGIPKQVCDWVESGKAQNFTSEKLISELQRILSYSKFPFSESLKIEIVHFLIANSTLVHPEITVSTLPDNNTDNRVLECALEAGADCIVTGDKLLRSLHPWGKIQILSSADFLKSDFVNLSKKPVSPNTL
jgi:putative PIN family toxin of toxin-antitoxin system